MDIQVEIQQLKHELDTINDVNLLRAIKSLLTYAKNKTPQESLKPMTMDELQERLDRSEQDIKDGKVYTTEEMSDYFRNKSK